MPFNPSQNARVADIRRQLESDIVGSCQNHLSTRFESRMNIDGQLHVTLDNGTRPGVVIQRFGWLVEDDVRPAGHADHAQQPPEDGEGRNQAPAAEAVNLESARVMLERHRCQSDFFRHQQLLLEILDHRFI